MNAPGTYTLTVSNPANGCSNSDTVTVTQDVTAAGGQCGPGQSLNCTITSVTLDGSSTTPGVTYKLDRTGRIHFNQRDSERERAGHLHVDGKQAGQRLQQERYGGGDAGHRAAGGQRRRGQVLNCTISSVTLDGMRLRRV